MHQSLTKLFVIIDPTSSEQIALEKALMIAMLTDCEIHAFVCDYEEISEHGEYASISNIKHHVKARNQGKAELLMQRFKDNNIPYSIEVAWNKYWYEYAVHAATRSGCDMILKSSFHHEKAIRFFNKTSDFSLMRYCATPILFTHRSQQWQSNRMLACLDLESGDPEHIRLNNSIIRVAKAMAETLSMELIIAAAYHKNIDERILRLDKDYTDNISDRIADIFGVDLGNVILRQGPTVEALQEICVEIEPSILAIGTIARTGIAGKLIGNTAEKLLDVIDADILTIT